jgi:hypothetical protein
MMLSLRMQHNLQAQPSSSLKAGSATHVVVVFSAAQHWIFALAPAREHDERHAPVQQAVAQLLNEGLFMTAFCSRSRWSTVACQPAHVLVAVSHPAPGLKQLEDELNGGPGPSTTSRVSFP